MLWVPSGRASSTCGFRAAWVKVVLLFRCGPASPAGGFPGLEGARVGKRGGGTRRRGPSVWWGQQQEGSLALSTCGGSVARCFSSAERASTWAFVGISPARSRGRGVDPTPASAVVKRRRPPRESHGPPRRSRSPRTGAESAAVHRTCEEEPEETLGKGLAPLLRSRELRLHEKRRKGRYCFRQLGAL